jgi:hypothetical protein
MPKLLLDDVQGSSFIRQFIGVSVAQAMRVYSLFDSDLCGQPFHQVPDVGRIQGPALQSTENRMPAIDAKNFPPV